MKISVLQALYKESLNVFTLILSLQGNSKNWTGNRDSQLGNSLAREDVVRDLTGARLPLCFPSDWPRHRSSISDDYCAQFVAGEVSPVSGKVNCFATDVEEIVNSVPIAGKDCYSVT